MAVSNETVERVARSHSGVICLAIMAATGVLVLAGFIISSQFEKPTKLVTVTYNPDEIELVGHGQLESLSKEVGVYAERVSKAEIKAQELQDKIDGKKPAAKVPYFTGTTNAIVPFTTSSGLCSCGITYHTSGGYSTCNACIQDSNN